MKKVDIEMTGTELRELRIHSRLTQRELADVLGVITQTVANYERGRSAIPEPVARLVLLLYRPRGYKLKSEKGKADNNYVIDAIRLKKRGYTKVKSLGKVR